jgi:hypothetical protein
MQSHEATQFTRSTGTLGDEIFVYRSEALGTRRWRIDGDGLVMEEKFLTSVTVPRTFYNAPTVAPADEISAAKGRAAGPPAHGHADLGTTSTYLQGIDRSRSPTPSAPANRRRFQ